MPRRVPEILAPAGSEESLRAALASGADSVYFGLDEGFNARARAANFSLENLPATVARIHRAGARAYLTVNTLVFEPELPVVEQILRRVAAAGVDAIIVQDPAVALIARAVCPELEVHASTQMTISSPEAAAFAEGLGVTRVVVPRELSVDEIRRFAAGTPLELEVFIHGALCVSWSGQCLTSETWGGRSANRGQCAQSCRLPYDLVVDAETQDLGDVRYLLSPKDLAGFPAVEELAEIGVASLKIEGRQKGPDYVATAVGGFRRFLDAGFDERVAAEALDDMTVAYSRGFGTGFLKGADHQTLVEGRFPKHRGAYLGRVAAVRPERREVVVEREGEHELRAGMGVVFDQSTPEQDEPGGPVFAVEGSVLRFGTPGPDLGRVRAGDRVWITSDPAIKKATARLLDGPEPEGRVEVVLTVTGAAGEPLAVRAEAPGFRLVAEARTSSSLSGARGGGIDRALLEDKLGALGGTPFRLGALVADRLAPRLHVPVSELKELRRKLVADLTAALTVGAPRTIATAGVLPSLRGAAASATPAGEPKLIPLCRTDEQLAAVIAAGLPEVELDWMELVGLGRAVERARAAGLKVTIATVRVQKPGEEGVDARIAKLEPDAVLVRHWGAVMCFSRGERRPAVHGDFSLNVTNSITARHVLALGLDSITAAHDLDEDQLFAMLAHAPADRFTVAIHHHIPTFHTEHCVYAHLLSEGRDYRTCGRPCEEHQVALRDRIGLEHPVVVDVGCRNTVFNAQAQSAAGLVPRLLDAGVRRFRVELVRETRAEAAAVLAAHADLLAGRIAPAEAIRRSRAHEQFGVTRGTMKVLRVVP